MTSSTVMDFDALIDKIERLSKKRPSELFLDDKSRAKLRDAARNLSVAMESRNDTVFRILNLPLQSAMARVGVDMKLFEVLIASKQPLTSTDIAVRTGVDRALMDRFLRHYTSHGMIAEAGLDRYAPSNVTTAMVSPEYDAAISFCLDVLAPTFTKLGQYMQENDYKDPTNTSSTLWQIAHNTSQTPFTWLKSHPDHSNNFNKFMKIQRDGLPIFLDAFPFEAQLTQNIKSGDLLFIDIGGSVGHQIQALRQRYHGPGRTILQDRAEVIAQAMDVPGMETMAYDFFTPQPVKGCRAYYMRNVLHDWPDETCIQILQNTMSAMTEDSVLLIDEMVLPERRVHWRAAHMDLMMMTTLAARERTMRQWEDLLNKAGLEIRKIWTYTAELQDSVIEAVPKKIAD